MSMLQVGRDRHEAKFSKEPPGHCEGYVKRCRNFKDRMKTGGYTRKKLRVVAKYVAASDADIRISRAINMLIEAKKVNE